ncbi:MAG: hypothetical protein OSA97_01505 [Nevskia sp.]|nr:hypothetical protein [Nevskia sp.]
MKSFALNGGGQLRDSVKELRAEFKSFRAWFFTGLIGVQLTVIGAFGWLVVERALAERPPAAIEHRQ